LTGRAAGLCFIVSGCGGGEEGHKDRFKTVAWRSTAGT